MTALERLDELLLRVEKTVVAAVLAVMGLVVFFDVVNRTVAGESPLFSAGLVVAGAVLGALAAGSRRRPVSPVRGAIAGGLGAAALAALPFVFPNGLVWSQPLALALTLWLGTIGASIAAHERRHLALDIGSKLWPAAVAPYAAAFGHLATGVFCVGLFVLAWRSLFGFSLDGQLVQGHIEVWSSSDGQGGTLSGTAIPKWAAVASIPYGMAMLAFRFGLEAWRAATGRAPTDADDPLHQLGIKTSEEVTR